MADTTPRRRRRGNRAAARVEAGRRLVGRYRLERRIGRGGSADVWRARDERLGRIVAIKALHPHLLPDAASRARFATEARAAAGLSHPAIVPVYDVIEDPHSPAIVLRFVGGTTLADRIAARGQISEREAVSMGADLAGALAHAHRLGIVHRDVKPGNVLIDEDGRVQLVDFGIARLLADAATRETTTGQVMGTLRYMAPEQLAGGKVDGRTDLYALGLLLHELLSGQPAFAAASPTELVDAQRQGPPDPPPRAGAELRSLLDQLLAADPARRPSDAAEVEARLRTIAGNLAGDPRSTAADSAAPTLIAGLPSATAGLALAVPPGVQERAADSEADPARAGDELEAGDGETIALPAAPTAAIPVPTSGGVADEPAAPASVAAAASVRAAVGAPVPRRFRIRRRAAVAGGAGLALGGIVVAAIVSGFGFDHPAAVTGVESPSPPAGPNPTAAPTPHRATAPKPNPPKPPVRRKRHGHHEGD